MKKFSADFGSDHINNILSNDIYKNIIELIWNSLDADAFNVYIDLNKSKLGGDEAGIIGITIKDDGHGLPFCYLEERFKQLGYSHKKLDEYSPKGRRFHGKKGQGRYSALNLGKSLNITTTYKEAGKYYKYNCDINYNSPKDVLYSEVIEDGSSSSFSISIDNLNINTKDIDIGILKNKIILEFADYINSYSSDKEISIFLNKKYIDIDEAINKRQSFSFKVIDENNGQFHSFKGEIIHWKSKGIHNRYFCTEEGTVLWSDRHTGLSEKNFGHSVYIKGAILRERYENNTHELLKGEPFFDSIGDEVKNKLATFFSKLLKSNSKNFIDKLKKDNLYPYTDLPSNNIEEREREMYDIFLYKIHTGSSKVFSGPNESKKMILELIKTGLEKDPKSMLKVLQGVVHLNKEDLASLSGMIGKYTLTSLIQISKSITDKLQFLGELDFLIHGDIHKTIKERAHLHKILEQELWVFGDGYIEGTSDKGMKAVLKKHIKILGREKLINDYNNLSKNVPDLFLYKQFPQSSEGHLKHLIIELKRPGLKLTSKELQQIKKYAKEVSEDTRFDKEKTEWEFLLISNTYNGDVEDEITQENRPKGCAIDKKNYKVYVKTWGEVLQGLRWKYSFLKNKLQNYEETPENLEYIKTNLPDIYEDIFGQ